MTSNESSGRAKSNSNLVSGNRVQELTAVAFYVEVIRNMTGHKIEVN